MYRFIYSEKTKSVVHKPQILQVTPASTGSVRENTNFSPEPASNSDVGCSSTSSRSSSPDWTLHNLDNERPTKMHSYPTQGLVSTVNEKLLATPSQPTSHETIFQVFDDCFSSTSSDDTNQFGEEENNVRWYEGDEEARNRYQSLNIFDGLDFSLLMSDSDIELDLLD